AFILFGALLSTTASTVPLVPTLVLAALVIGVARPVAIALVLGRAAISPRARAFIGWFGPRGLNSLLFALLAVRDGVPAAEQLLAIVGVVVMVSVVLHGVSATPVSAWYGRRVARETLAEERESTAAGLFEAAADEVPRLTPAELARSMAEPNPPIILDVRSRSSYDPSGTQIPGSLRVLPDRIAEWANEAPRGRLLVTYCT
ncbi:MAG: cation:proton antiporter, partial [Chloroflexi bacterium]|nr:cation:proton antiporter [Chloroflexota bacterium]